MPEVSAGVLNQPPTSHLFAYQISVEALGRLTTPEQFGDVVVKADAKGRVTRIRDIARVELGAADYGSKAYADRYDSAPFWVIAQPGANVVQVEHAVWDKMAELKKHFPSGLDYINIYDPTTFVSQSIAEVIETIFIAIALVVGVVFLFLQNWRATIVPVVAIPISLVGTFTILTALGASINNLSLFGLVLAVGIVVDDAIVVVENVERNMRLGMSPRDAAYRTMDEVSTALLAIALTLCAVFVPAAFISGITGLFFKQFAITISASTGDLLLCIPHVEPRVMRGAVEAVRGKRGAYAGPHRWSAPRAPLSPPKYWIRLAFIAVWHGNSAVRPGPGNRRRRLCRIDWPHGCADGTDANWLHSTTGYRVPGYHRATPAGLGALAH